MSCWGKKKKKGPRNTRSKIGYVGRTQRLALASGNEVQVCYAGL